MWRRTRLRHINLALYALIAVLVVFNMREIRWAAESLPMYLTGGIPSPEERKLYREARRIIRGEPDRFAEARPLLDRSISIDPNAEGYYWLGRYFLDDADVERAAEAFEKYLEIDPVIADTYLFLADIYLYTERREEAIRILEQGREYFSGQANRYEPVTIMEVRMKFNEKAERVYEYYQSSSVRLTEKLETVRRSAKGE